MIVRLHWWKEFRADGLQNYGDLMSIYLVKKLSKKIVITNRSKYNIYVKKIIKHYYIVIGSVIGAANKNAIVWGSGIISKDQHVGNAKFIAVRGPRTRQHLINLGYQVPLIYGDPAILLPLFIKNNSKKKYKYGIIPHFVDYKLVCDVFKDNDQIKIIKLLTHSVEKTTKEILECEYIISSSLHGLIVGHSYRIPSIWIKFSDNLSGDDIKFFDYFESLDINYNNIFYIKPRDLSLEKITSIFNKNQTLLLPNINILEKRQKALIESCPF